MAQLKQKKEFIDDLRIRVDEILPKSYSNDTNEVAQALFAVIDINNNGYASFAEINKGLTDTIKLPKTYGVDGILMKAYNKAKIIKRSQDKKDNDYVSKDEFVYVLLYLRIYYELYMEFSLMDENNDMTITLQQLEKAKNVLSKWKIDTSNLPATFKEIDTDGKGTISFNELCEWAINKYFSLEFTK